MWETPTAEQLRLLLERGTDMPAAEIDRVVRSYRRPRLARLTDLDREFARRVLARCARRMKR
jgi:hypothetical protein